MVGRIKQKLRRVLRGGDPQPADNPGDKQALDLYWDSEMAEVLETWGYGNAWSEIQFLLSTNAGRVLDIACGTGKVMDILKKFPRLEVHGCDISDFLIEKAVARGLNPQLLKVCDATETGYKDNFFDYSYSIGSLEHFTEDGIAAFLTEARRASPYSGSGSLSVLSEGRGDEQLLLPGSAPLYKVRMPKRAPLHPPQTNDSHGNCMRFFVVQCFGMGTVALARRASAR